MKVFWRRKGKQLGFINPITNEDKQVPSFIRSSRRLNLLITIEECLCQKTYFVTGHGRVTNYNLLKRL